MWVFWWVTGLVVVATVATTLPAARRAGLERDGVLRLLARRVLMFSVLNVVIVLPWLGYYPWWPIASLALLAVIVCMVWRDIRVMRRAGWEGRRLNDRVIRDVVAALTLVVILAVDYHVADAGGTARRSLATRFVEVASSSRWASTVNLAAPGDVNRASVYLGAKTFHSLITRFRLRQVEPPRITGNTVVVILFAESPQSIATAATLTLTLDLGHDGASWNIKYVFPAFHGSLRVRP